MTPDIVNVYHILLAINIIFIISHAAAIITITITYAINIYA
jgi:hypothetical protein